MHPHVESKDIMRKKLLLNHAINYRKASAGHLGISKAQDGIIVVVKDMLLNYHANGLVHYVNGSFKIAQSEIVNSKVPFKFP